MQGQANGIAVERLESRGALLVTGGAGFIGSHLAEFCTSLGHEVVVLDNLSTGQLRNLEGLLDRIRFIEADVARFDFAQLQRPAAVVHLAAQASVPLSIEDFSGSSTANLLGTVRVLDYCRHQRVPLVYASSSAVYGDLPLGDDESPEVSLPNPYAIDKYAMELYARVAHRLYGLSSLGLRFFNVYGPRQDPASPYSGVISIFAGNLLGDRPLRVFGGHQTRDFVYVKDVARTIYKAVGLAAHAPLCDVVNVLTGSSISIERLAQQLSGIFGKDPEKIYSPLPPGDPEKSAGTTAKMCRTFGVGLNAFTPLGLGLQDTVSSIRAGH